jgi:FkbM family methyltransferase
MRKFLIKYFPSFGRYKRFVVAVFHKIFVKSSYSQYQEDTFFLDFLEKHKIDVCRYIYVDVGANHPTDISNTYLLYRKGMSGIVLEPNRELCRLFKFARGRDTVLNIGCSNFSGITRFNVSKTPVLSSFRKEWQDSEIYLSYLVPVLRLDDALRNIQDKDIFLLTVDTEGYNYMTLEGSVQTLKKSLLVCLEWDEENEKRNYEILLGPDFSFLRDFGCNSVYLNQKMLQHLN